MGYCDVVKLCSLFRIFAGIKKIGEFMVKNVLKGMLIGIANIIPGVSGGTMAVSMGIYDRLIHCISHPFEDFKNNVFFLIPIAVGMGLAIIASAF